MPLRFLILCCSLVASLTLHAASVVRPAEQVEFFEQRIRPILAQECYECHSTAMKKKGGLLLDSRAGWQAGGKSGDAIVVGNAKASLLMQSIRHEHDDLKMPKSGAKLDDKVIADFERWINSGAVDPRDAPPSNDEVAKETAWPAVLERRKQWWALQPLRSSDLAQGKAANPVDNFIRAKLKEHDLKIAAPAEAGTLLRRLSYVLTGLPPTPEALTAFQKETTKDRPTAIANTIDALLKSERFGEAWARHWMDWVRYAETYGSEGDPTIPNAWRYRDYLIRALNADVPYPQLVKEAIAGDLLPQPRINAALGINESALGIGQLRMVNHGFSPTDSLDEMVTFTDNQIDVVSKAFLGFTVSCARCHNHKFDAISQADFYSWFGVFSSTHPAVIDVSLPQAGKADREQLVQLKKELKAIVGKTWINALTSGKVAPTKPDTASHAALPDSEILSRWDLSTAPWFHDGKGIAQGASKAGEFSVALEGDKIIAHLHPAGVFSDLVSTKDRGVLFSPTFKCEGGTLWMRSAGNGSARAKYVVQNYPRTGTIHKAVEFKEPKDEALSWRSLDLDYWKGDTIFIQFATGQDLPVENRGDRSWFGATEIVITRGKAPPSKPAIDPDVRGAVQAWMSGTMTDAQAEALDALLLTERVPNDIKAIAQAAPLLAKYREIEARLAEPIRAPGVLEADAHDAALFVRGDHKQPSELVKRHFLDGIDAQPFNSKQSGRLELAEHLASPQNVLAARVIVNRLWHYVFGRGLVSTTDNFGKLGSLPTHPELLDYLAQRFISSGGSIKDMLRLLVTSQTFQAADSAGADVAIKDPDNAFLSHWTVRRLGAESIRDSIVGLTGKLDLTMYGEPVPGKELRRSVYVQVIRNRLDDFLAAFDAPVPMTTRGARDVTNVPAQSLALLNNPTIERWASEWAKDTMQQQKDDAQRAQQMFTQALGRRASAEELASCLTFLKGGDRIAENQRTELAKLESQATAVRSKLDAILTPKLQKLSQQRGTKPAANLPEPYAEWDFEQGLEDRCGHLPLSLEGTAKLDHGALMLDGKGFARSAALPKNVTAKTLEAWVQLDTLDQRGGGVVTMQDQQGGVFDSLVFAEKTAGEWLAGSDNHKRTQAFNGPQDKEAATRAVHLAITYANGKVIGYRNGQPYGQPFDSATTASFAAGDAVVLLGCRHGSAAGNKGLHGRILRARLYDRALSAEEIAKTSTLEATSISEHEVLAALTEEQRQTVQQLKAELDPLTKQSTALSEQLARTQPEIAGWQSLALSLLNLKEFIYLR